jgi:hypothetical protein
MCVRIIDINRMQLYKLVECCLRADCLVLIFGTTHTEAEKAQINLEMGIGFYCFTTGVLAKDTPK